MVSAPPRKRLPALLLVVVGLFFCTVAVTGSSDLTGGATYAITQDGDSCSDSSIPTYEFDDLSPRGQAFFLETLESESSILGSESSITIRRATPSKFSVGAGDSSGLFEGDGLQCITKDGTEYKLGINGGGGFGGFYLNLFVRGPQLIGGVGLAIVGAFSYKKSKALLPSVLLGGSAVFVISPLLWIVGLFRWSMWMWELPQFQIAGVITGLASLLAVLYSIYSDQWF